MSKRPLSEIAIIVQGGRHRKSGLDFVSSGFPAFGAGGQNGFLDFAEFDTPGVILSAIGARCGKCFYAEGRWSSLANTQIIFPKPDLADAKFLWFQLNDENRWHRSGTGQPFIKPSDVKSHLVFAPSLDEQKRIAALLEKADVLRRKRQEALYLTDDFLRSTFLDLFGDPLTNTRQLPMKPLREFGEIVTGNTPPRSEPENFGSAVEWIKSDNINTPNYYITSAEERLSPLGAAKARKVPANSILVTCIAGSPSCIGNVALTNREVAFNQQINAVVPAKDTDPFFLFTQFLVGKKKIQNASTNGMKGMVSKGTFSEIEFLAPPEAKQREFGDFFRHMEELHRKNEEAFTATETLFSALQQRAFSGEL